MRGAGGLEGGDGGFSGGGGGSPSGPAGGIDITGTYPSGLSVVGLRGRPIAVTVPLAGHVLAYDGAQWVPASPLPSQGGNANKVLTTNGTTASWTATLIDVALTGTTTLDGTATAAGTATIDLAAAASVTVPPRLASDSSAAAASTAHVKAYLPAPGAAGTVHRSNGSAWVTTTLGVADVVGAAPLTSPAFAANPTAPTPAPGDNSLRIATTAFVANALTTSGALPVDYHPATRLQTVASSAPGFIDYLTLNFTALGGTYAFVITMILSGSSATTQIETNLVIDAISYGGTKRETGITNGVDIYTGTNSFPFAAGPHTITLQFQHSGGPGTTSCTFSAIQVWKVA